MSTALQSYVDEINAKGIPCIGNVVFYSATEATRISYEDMVTRLTDNNLEAFLPGKPRDNGAWLRTTQGIERRKQRIGTTDHYENILVRKVYHSEGAIEKHVVVEIVDANDRRLDYKPVVQMQYLPVGHEFTVAPLGFPIHDRALALAGEAKEAYDYWKGHLHSDAVRDVMSWVIGSTHALTIRPSGGVFFILDDFTGRLQHLMDAVDGIPGISLNAVPLINSADQREMLKRAFESETVGEMIKITGSIRDMLKDPTAKVPRSEADRIVNQVIAIREKATAYENLLGNTLAAAGLHESALKQAISQMQWRTA